MFLLYIYLRKKHEKIIFDLINLTRIIIESLNIIHYLDRYCIYNWRMSSKKIEHHQSKSLWNYTLSPGWKQ